MPNFEQQIIWSDIRFEFRMTSAFIWYTYCWYVTKNDQFFIFTYWSPFWIFWPISGPFPVHFRSISGPKISSYIPCIWLPASKTTSGSLKGHFLGGVKLTPPQSLTLQKKPSPNRVKSGSSHVTYEGLRDYRLYSLGMTEGFKSTIPWRVL